MTAVNNMAATSQHHRTTARATYENLDVRIENGIYRLTFNRPEKNNAISLKMFQEVPEALKEAGNNENVVICYVTGTGNYYSSGNDINNFTTNQNIDPEDIPEFSKNVIKKFVAAFIDFPKPLIAGLNGPAIGVATTTLGLFDAVYASDRATLQTPFIPLGLCPEGCSSYTFPRIMGQAKASELLMFNRKITAKQAADWGLVTEVFPHDRFHDETETRLQRYSEFPKQSMILSKQLIRGFQKEMLHKVNERELDLIGQLMQSEEAKDAIMAFFSRKSKM